MSKNEEKKASVWKKIGNTFNMIPKIGRTIIIVAVLALFVYLGSTISDNFRTNSKATKFGLQDMGELITQTAFVTIVQDSRDDRDFFKLFKIPFTESRMIFSYDFTVDASVNFEKITYEVDDENKEIKVKLPHPTHYKTTLDLDSQVVYLDQGNLFSRIDLKEHNEAMIKMETNATNTAIENNLLEAADKNAQKIIAAMFKSDSKRKDYKVTYKYID